MDKRTVYQVAVVLVLTIGAFVWALPCGALAASPSGETAVEAAASDGAGAKNSDDPLAFMDSGKFSNESDGRDLKEASFLTSLLRMVSALALVVGLMIGVMFLLKQLIRISPQMRRFAKVSDDITVLARGGVAKKAEVLVVKVRDREYVLALTGDRCTVIDRLTSEGAPFGAAEESVVQEREAEEVSLAEESHFSRLMSFIGRSGERKNN